MIEINDFKDLTTFLYSEYEKRQDGLGEQIPSRYLLSYADKSLIKYMRLYDKPLYKRAKEQLKLQRAFDTMPHGKVWKFFHSDLWKKMQYMSDIDTEELNKEIAETKNLIPVIMKNVGVPQMSELSHEHERKQ